MPFICHSWAALNNNERERKGLFKVSAVAATAGLCEQELVKMLSKHLWLWCCLVYNRQWRFLMYYGFKSLSVTPPRVFITWGKVLPIPHYRKAEYPYICSAVLLCWKKEKTSACIITVTTSSDKQEQGSVSKLSSHSPAKFFIMVMLPQLSIAD